MRDSDDGDGEKKGDNEKETGNAADVDVDINVDSEVFTWQSRRWERSVTSCSPPNTCGGGAMMPA